MFSSRKDSFQLPEASLEDVTRQRAEYESASKHGHETRDALIRCGRSSQPALLRLCCMALTGAWVTAVATLAPSSLLSCAAWYHSEHEWLVICVSEGSGRGKELVALCDTGCSGHTSLRFGFSHSRPAGAPPRLHYAASMPCRIAAVTCMRATSPAPCISS